MTSYKVLNCRVLTPVKLKHYNFPAVDNAAYIDDDLKTLKIKCEVVKRLSGLLSLHIFITFGPQLVFVSRCTYIPLCIC